MYKSKLSKVIVALLRRIAGVTRSGANRLMRAMLRSLMAMGRRANLPVAGFVLPTVTMVLLVVILLTVAITLRSFDRANMARNVRVNQQVLAAATPAIDRAKAKIQYLVGEGSQVTGTPSDRQLYLAMSSYPATPTPTNPDLYTFGDEDRLRVKYDLDGNGTVAAFDPANLNALTDEQINTAWRYPVDTNNDGNFDTFTLYGIFFRNPPLNAAGSAVARARKPLDARTPPMALGFLDPACLSEGAGDSVATLVGDSGWYKLDGKLRKSFFVYTVNVPITQKDITDNNLPSNNYQAFTGTSSISALEYQQDQSRIPLGNNAVVYEDDLEISPGADLNLNGRILTNSNLLVTRTDDTANFNLFQVSSRGSCFYDQENSRIQVAGNVVNGWSGNLTNRPVNVHLFKEKTGTVEPNAAPAIINPTNQSVTNNSLQVIYNGNAYSRRLNALVQGQIQAHPDTPNLENDPLSVQLLVKPPAGSTQPPMSRANALESYFKDRLRKVPFAEALLGSDGGVVAGVAFNTYIQESGDSLRPIDNWSLPTTGDANVGSASGSGRTELTLDLDQLESRNPEKITSTDSELNLGERVAVGNNLPALRWDGTSKFLGAAEPQKVGGPWTGGEPDRTRKSQVTKLADVGATDRGNGFGERPGTGTPPFRDGFWEAVAAQTPRNPLDGTGGLRVITSGGVYDRTNSFLPPPRWNDGTSKRGPSPFVAAPGATNTYDDPATTAVELYPVVWPDTMPMSPLGAGSKVYDNTAVPTAVLPDTWILIPPLPDLVAAAPAVLPGIVEQAATAKKFAKGDLRMRATAVYHYAFNGYNPDTITGIQQPDQRPYACVSSYYDPSNASTARNITSGGIGTDVSTDVSGQGARAPSGAPTLGSRQAFIGSNNGITYPATTRTRPPGNSNIVNGVLTGGEAVLDMQASLVFPDGRFANGPLRTALLVPEAGRTLAQKAAIDSTFCALDILAGATPDPGLIPHGAIQEVAFLNGREIKAVERDDTDTPNVNEAFTLSGTLPLTPATTLRVNYNQPLEEREPLEIRATQLNIRALRQTPKPVAGEWLLPNSGIIYASRDDALPDRSDRSGTPATGLDETTSKRVSPSDSILDPSRKPNGIVLINGNYLFRGGATPTPVTSVADVVREKGLTLVSNLPVYIQGEFNTHGRIPPTPPGAPPATVVPVEEFTANVNANWDNFYQRTKNQLNPNFACREGDPRLPSCGGDYWRQANVLADAVTLLSARYRFGFRNEGDFDLRNNAGAEAVLRRRQRGFFNNNFVTNGLSSGAFLTNGNLKPPATLVTDATVLKDATYIATPTTPSPILTSSYFNNFVTPVQRRGAFPEYVMEVCRKLPVSECGDDDWFVDLTGAGRTALDAAPGGVGPYAPPAVGASFQAGSTFDPPLPALQRFPRRVAFAKDPATPATPQPLAITGGITIAPVPPGTNAPAPIAGRANSLWFAGGRPGTAPVFNNTTSLYVVNIAAATPPNRDGSNTPLPALIAGATPAPPVLPLLTQLNGTQPLLMPFLQIRNVTGTANNFGSGISRVTGWISQAENTTFNLIMATGDTPSVNINGAVGDQNGGLQNLPRFLENWFGGFTTNIKGSFIQINRSAFSTAPYQPILGATPPGSVAADNIKSVFGLSTAPSLSPLGLSTDPLRNLDAYNTQGAGNFAYFTPPNRNWGYDVGLLPQPPDLFTQKFTTPPSKSQPAEFFREVPRNDEWVKTLMCGIRDDGSVGGGSTPATSSRPTDCPQKL